MAGFRNGLRLVETVESVETEFASFCTNCGTDAGDPALRVCSSCHMGVILEVDAALAPQSGDAFLIADSSLNVGGVSDAASRWLGRGEQELVHRPLTDLFEPAEVTKSAPRSLLGLMHAAVSASGVYTAVVRPTGMFGVHVKARFGQCAPSGLLVLLDVPQRRR